MENILKELLTSFSFSLVFLVFGALKFYFLFFSVPCFWGSEILRIALNIFLSLHKLLEECKRRRSFRKEELHPLSVAKVNQYSTPQFVSKNQVTSFSAKVEIEDHLARGKRKNDFIEKYGQLALL